MTETLPLTSRMLVRANSLFTGKDPVLGRQRFGQACFNALYEIAPEIANEIRTTGADPFYDDTRVPDFLLAIENFEKSPDEA